jgi:predicted nucleotidyltransferase
MATNLLVGIVGSTAYGLAHENSDVDFLGIYADDTLDRVSRLWQSSDSVVTKDPDKTMHEIGKYLKLCLKGNPTLNELLWLPNHLYVDKHELGEVLIDIRQAFLSKKAIRNAYLGYATQQFNRYISRGKFNSDISDARALKHARHMYRLVLQGYMLSSEGVLEVKVEDPKSCRAWAAEAVENPKMAEEWLKSWEKKYDEDGNALPDKPDYSSVEGYLRIVRRELWHA